MVKGKLKKYSKSIAIVSSALLIFLSGCTPVSQNEPVTGKDEITFAHAQITETVNTDESLNTDNGNEDDNGLDEGNTDTGEDGNNENNPENDDNTPKIKEAVYKDPCGFQVTNPNSFADRAQGVYKIVSDSRIQEYIEIYNVNDNLYGFYSGNGYGAMELFTDDYVGFASNKADTLPVKILSFSSQTNNGYYISNGRPALMDMTLTEDGIEFTNLDTASGDTLFTPSECKLERVEGEMGHLDGFAYMDDDYSAELLCEDLDIETTDTPKDLIGSWILLGDTESGIIFEFTKEGYVQVYLKNYNIEVSFLRGTYTVGKDKVNGGTDIFMFVEQIGMGDANAFNMCYVMEDEYMILVPGNQEFGLDVAWEGATFIPYDMSNIPRQDFDENAASLQSKDYYGSYISDDLRTLILTEGDYFYLYEQNDEGEYTELVEGSFIETQGSLELYELDYKDGDDKYYGSIALWDRDNLDLTIDKTKETIRFTRG